MNTTIDVQDPKIYSADALRPTINQPFGKIEFQVYFGSKARTHTPTTSSAESSKSPTTSYVLKPLVMRPEGKKCAHFKHKDEGD